MNASGRGDLNAAENTTTSVISESSSWITVNCVLLAIFGFECYWFGPSVSEIQYYFRMMCAAASLFAIAVCGFCSWRRPERQDK